MQMMTYMDIVLQNKRTFRSYRYCETRGLLYFHVHEPRIKFKSWADIDEDQFQKDYIKTLK